MAITGFPEDAICYILVDIPGQGEFQGTGAIIGPHTILTAAHLVYDADTDVTADRISLYPGFTPDNGTYNPPGALPGLQSIHTIKVDDRNDQLSAAGTQSDFAVIDTSADITGYGSFALDPSFTSGDVVVKGYPASNNGYLTGTGGVVSQDGTLSDIGTSRLPLSPGYSGGPIQDDLYRDGDVIPAVVGTVSTNIDGMKLTKPKVDLIRHWIASDASLYAGGDVAPKGLIPQLDGTVASQAAATALTGAPERAAAGPFTYADAPDRGGDAAAASLPVVDPALHDLVEALQRPAGGSGETAFASLAADVGPGPGIMAPVPVFRPGQGFGIDTAADLR